MDDIFGDSSSSDEEDREDAAGGGLGGPALEAQQAAARRAAAVASVGVDGKRLARHPLARVDLWAAEFHPKHLGPMVLEEALASVGGGRGYVAAQDLEPGTLLIA